MRVFLVLSVSLLIITGLFSEPLTYFLVKNESGFTIEAPIFLPSGYRDVAEREYFRLSRNLPFNYYIEVTYRSSEGGSMVFTQSLNNKAVERLLTSRDSTLSYTQENILLGGDEAAATYYRNGQIRYVWYGFNKRYDLTVNDPYLTRSDVEKFKDSLREREIDLFKPVKKLVEGFGR